MAKGKGNGAGRPRTTTPPTPDLIALGKEMLAWVKQHDPLHLSEWYSVEKGILYETIEKWKEKPEFRGYYETSMFLIGKKYLDGESRRVKESVSQRWQRIYFKDVTKDEDSQFNKKLDKEYEHKRALIKYQTELATEAISNASPEIVEQLTNTLNQLAGMQVEALDARSARKAAKRISNSD